MGYRIGVWVLTVLVDLMLLLGWYAYCNISAKLGHNDFLPMQILTVMGIVVNILAAFLTIPKRN